ncbi:MAG: cupredoxin domain-containing protein [Acetobacteraceae bacterium]|jgi:plastocyanin
MNRITALAIVLLAVLAVPLAARAQPSRDEPAETVTIQLSNFAFNPDRLRLHVGVPIRLHLENTSSGGHNFSAPALFAASILPPGSPPENGKIEVAGRSSMDITLTPRAPGTYKVECTHFLHSLFGMTATIVVVGP